MATCQKETKKTCKIRLQAAHTKVNAARCNNEGCPNCDFGILATQYTAYARSITMVAKDQLSKESNFGRRNNNGNASGI